MDELRIILSTATFFWGVGFLFSFTPRNLRLLSRICLYVATLCGVAYVMGRYWLTLPMMPMFMGAVGVAPVMSVFLSIASLRQRHCANTDTYLRYGMALCFAMSMTAQLFPKDFYLPFLKTALVYPHVMLATSLLGRACLMLAGVWAILVMTKKLDHDVRDNMSKMLIWGVAFWTVSLFAGEMWCYAGWGVPIVWEDATIITAMATWFYYIAVIHLHLMAKWSHKVRAGFISFGIIIIVVFNCIIEFGPYRPLFRL